MDGLRATGVSGHGNATDASRVAVDVTAVLVTLDEAANVAACLASVRDAGVVHLLVVDASSQDATARIAAESGATVHVVPRRGLAYQRQFGVDLVATPYVLMLDADNRFRPDTVRLLLEDLERTGMAGVAPRKIAQDATSYWARAWSWHNDLSYATPGPRMVIGTPALYRTAVLKEVRYDPAMTVADDTDLCLRLARAGWQVGAGPGVCDELVRVTFRAFARKVQWYGRGDAEFFRKHADRRLSIASHPLRSYLLRGSARAVRVGRIDLVPFYVVYALLRSWGFLGASLALWRRGGLGVYRT
jgi:glycosyltransferase involved in cell wall biosynthesis